MDGTFKTAPKLFKQLYIVRAKLGDTAIACAYALFSAKCILCIIIKIKSYKKKHIFFT